MNLAIYFSSIYVPELVKKRYLKKIFIITAKAFKCNVPDISKLSYRESLVKFAEFSCSKAQKLSRENIIQVEEILYNGAYQLGSSLRNKLNIKTRSEILLMSKIMYKVINIDFKGNIQGEVTIKKCFFSNYYNKDVCEIISYLDRGMAAGLSGGGQLDFQQMITEGKNCCKAYFNFGDDII